jgi:hypothetical protein
LEAATVFSGWSAACWAFAPLRRQTLAGLVDREHRRDRLRAVGYVRIRGVPSSTTARRSWSCRDRCRWPRARQRDGDGERVKLAYEGLAPEEGTLFRQPELGQRWVLFRKRGARESRVPLFDQGIEDLLVRVLGLPKPTE